MGDPIRIPLQVSESLRVPLELESGILPKIIEGISPEVSLEETEDGVVMTVTDKTGTETALIPKGEPGEQGEPGEPGQPGQPGNDGVSPTISVTDITGGHRVTITDATGEHSFDVMDGETGGVSDVQVNSISVVQDGVANIPKASNTVAGVLKTATTYGTAVQDGIVYLVRAISSQIKDGAAYFNPIVPNLQHESTFYGLAKAAGDATQSQSTNPVGAYTDDAKEAIKSMLGIMEWISLGWRKAGESGISFSNGTEVSSNAFANTNYILVAPYRKIRYMQVASTMTSMTTGMAFYDKDYVYLSGKKGLANQSTNDPQPDEIDVPDNAVYARFTYRKDTQTYADFSISGYGYPCTVQDVQVNGVSVVNQGVANVPVASSSEFGAVMVGNGLGIDSNNKLRTVQATGAQLKQGTNQYNPVTSGNHEYAAFYGLAKAAGADMASSSNPVGTYTDAAKVAIQKMLGIYQAPWELIREDTVTNATEADVEITVDGNGQAFELTDIFLVVYTSSDTGSAKADYGRIRLVYGSSNEYSDIFVGGAMSAGQTGIVKLIQEENAVFKSASQRASTGSNSTLQMRNDYRGNAYAMAEPIDIVTGVRAYTSINITKVTGGFGYKLYGKRKCN